MTGRRNGFDRLAVPYRWLEHLTFGHLLERCRFHFLPQLTGARHALVLGDGDGRFAAQLLRAAPEVRICAVDGSEAMLRSLQARCGSARVSTLQADLSQGLPAELPGDRFDLVTTHFFLDCLDTAQVDELVADTLPRVRPGADWIVSEFDIPRGAIRWPAAVLVRLLYLGFRLLTGLRTQQLPDWRAAMRRHGFERRNQYTLIRGVLVAERWTAPGRVRNGADGVLPFSQPDAPPRPAI